MRFRRRTRFGTGDKGATLVEAALVIPLLLMIAIGSAEVGLTFVDWMSVSNATREGARVGSAAGNSADADDLILQVVARASCNINNGRLVQVRVFESDANGDQVDPARQNVYPVASMSCQPFSVTWGTATVNWPSTSRSTDIGDLDYLGVEVRFEHDTVTGLFPIFNTTWNDRTVMRLEPTTQ